MDFNFSENKKSIIENSSSKEMFKNNSKGERDQNDKMIEETIISRSELRKRLPTLEKMYDFCVDDLELYLPRFDSWTKKAKCITEDYLWGCYYWTILVIENIRA